ncbi:MAG: transglutaminase-like domain-containing protein [Gammaproteobacteria bacterium]|nr:transglutaminase-like domain-containing protein [Gammaproteobacteria bacterium]
MQGVLTRVRQRLDYVPGAAPPDLDALLQTGEGDCWEFAALFDALAERVGLDSRTVTGLAWTGDESGRLALHAWNEVRVGGRLAGGGSHLEPASSPTPPGSASRTTLPSSCDLQIALAGSKLELVSVDGVDAGIAEHRP